LLRIGLLRTVDATASPDVDGLADLLATHIAAQ
jgi:hypothetical protein